MVILIEEAKPNEIHLLTDALFQKSISLPIHIDLERPIKKIAAADFFASLKEETVGSLSYERESQVAQRHEIKMSKLKVSGDYAVDISLNKKYREKYDLLKRSISQEDLITMLKTRKLFGPEKHFSYSPIIISGLDLNDKKALKAFMKISHENEIILFTKNGTVIDGMETVNYESTTIENGVELLLKKIIPTEDSLKKTILDKNNKKDNSIIKIENVDFNYFTNDFAIANEEYAQIREAV